MDLGGSSVMYHLKPVFEPSALQFQNPSSMYRLKNLQTSTITTTNFQVNNVDESTEIDQNTLSRQEKLLANLHKLHEDVVQFEKKLKTLKFVNDIPKANCLDLFRKAEIHDFVINADPDYPPYALLWLSKLWEIRFNITIHTHSSLQSSPGHLSVFDKLKCDAGSSSFPTMTLVWKKIGQDIELIVSPTKYKTVVGEVNVLRFFDYILSPGESVLQQVRKNEFLDLVHRIGHVSSKDQQLIVMQLHKRLGKGTWMVGSGPTMVDAVTWSALAKLKKKSKLAALNEYMTSCSEFVGSYFLYT